MDEAILKDFFREMIKDYGYFAWDLLNIISLDDTYKSGYNISWWFEKYKSNLKTIWNLHTNIKNWDIDKKQFVDIENTIPRELFILNFYALKGNLEHFEDPYDEYNLNRERLKNILYANINIWRENIFNEQLIRNDENLKSQLQGILYLDKEIYQIGYRFDEMFDTQDFTIHLSRLTLPYSEQLLVMVGLGYWSTRITTSGFYFENFSLMPLKFFPTWLNPDLNSQEMREQIKKLKENRTQLIFYFQKEEPNSEILNELKNESLILQELKKIKKEIKKNKIIGIKSYVNVLLSFYLENPNKIKIEKFKNIILDDIEEFNKEERTAFYNELKITIERWKILNPQWKRWIKNILKFLMSLN